MKSLSKIFESAGIIFITIVLSKILGYFFRIIVARTSVELYGTYNLAYIIISLVIPFCLLGLNIGIMRYVPYYLAKNQKEKADEVITTVFKIVLPISLAFFFLFSFSADFIAGFFDVANLSIALRYFAFMIPTLVLLSIFSSILIANQKVILVSLFVNVVESSIRFIVVLVMFYLGFKFLGPILGFLLPNLLILSFVFYYSKKFFSWKKGSFISEFVFFSIPLSLVSIFLALIGYMDTIFLGALTDISEVAFYNVALPTAHLLFIFSTSLLALFLPLVTEKYAKNQNLKGDYMSVTKWIFMSTLPFSLIMILFSDNILWILFGQKYLSASITLSILAFSFFINSLAQPSKHILIMLKKSKLILVLVCVAFSLNILLNIILIPFFDKNYAHGMYGAALSTMISLFFLALSNLIFAYKNTKIFLFNKTHIKISLAAFMSTLIVYFIQKMFIVQSIWHLISFLIIYLFLYVFLIFYLKILEEHDKIVLGALKKRITSLVPSFLIRD